MVDIELFLSESDSLRVKCPDIPTAASKAKIEAHVAKVKGKHKGRQGQVILAAIREGSLVWHFTDICGCEMSCDSLTDV